MSYDTKILLSDSHNLVLKILRKSLVLIDEIKTDNQRRAMIQAKYELSKCERIYGLIRDFAKNPTDGRWLLEQQRTRSYHLRDKMHGIGFHVWHRYVGVSEVQLVASNITARVEFYNVLSDDEKVILYVVCSLAVEMDKKLSDLERQQREMRMQNKLKGLY